MSNSQVPLKVVRQCDPVVDISHLDQRTFYAYDGGQENSFYVVPAQNVNNTTISINAIPPALNIITDPKIFMKVKFSLAFVGTTSGPTVNLLQVGTADAPRSFPVSSVINTVSASINGQQTSTVLNQYFQPMMRYGDVRERYDLDYSTTPQQLDQCVEYKDLYNEARSPFQPFGANTFEQPRGGFSGLNVLTNTTTTATATLECYEPIFLSPFLFSKKGLINVKNLSTVFTFGDLKRVWSHDATNGQTISSLVVNITEFQLVFRYITPKIVENIPKSIVLDYHEIVPSIQSSGSILAGASVTLSMNTLNLQATPDCLYIYARKADSDLTFNDADSFLRLDNISVNYQGRTGLLASAPIQALYRISSENGYAFGWDMWSKKNGSVLKLKFGKDIALPSNQAPSLLNSPQLSYTATFTNLSSQTISNVQLFTQIVYCGSMVINEAGSMSKSTAVLTSTDILNAFMNDAPYEVAEQEAFHDNYMGGNIVDDVMAFGKDVIAITKSGIQLGKHALPLVGLGSSGGDISGGRVKGGAMSGGKMKKGKGYSGGEVVDRAQLAERMEDLEYY